MRPQSALVIPSAEELIEIAKVSLHIPREHIPFFVQSVQSLAHTLLNFQKRGISLNEAITRTRSALSVTITNLCKAQVAFSSEEYLIRYFSDEDLAGDLASLFSIPGIKTLARQYIEFSLDEREYELAVQRSRDGGAQWVQTEIQRAVRQVMAENPAQPVANLIGLLIKHLEDQVALIGPVPRGKPPNQERQYALTQLSHTFERVFDAKPTPSPEGRFCDMCELVFHSFAMSTIGLDTAIGRHLAK